MGLECPEMLTTCRYLHAFFFLLCHLSEQMIAASPVKALFWNVFEGLGGRTDPRMKELKRIVSDFHVVTLSELNHWDANALHEFFREDFPFSIFLETKTGYHLGALSKAPIIEKVVSSDKPMHHGILVFETYSIIFCLIHLDPHSSEKRVSEVKHISNTLSPYMDKPVLILGDFNTLSPTDNYTEDSLKTLYDNRQTRKKFFRSSQIDYRPFTHLTVSDTYFDLGKANDFSVPTPVNADFMHATKLRLDYIMGNEHARRASLSAAAVLNNEETSVLSDHFPITITFDRSVLASWKSQGGGAKEDL